VPEVETNIFRPVLGLRISYETFIRERREPFERWKKVRVAIKKSV
jgi:hypothetical protein